MLCDVSAKLRFVLLQGQHKFYEITTMDNAYEIFHEET